MGRITSDMQLQCQRFRLTVSYDGTAYAGWQVQPGHPPVQQAIEKVLAGVVGTPVKVHGSGRTDQGVHARGQVAHVDLHTRMDPWAVQRALNARLPHDIRVRRVARAAPDFHARRHAVFKEYRYFIWNEDIMPPERRLYATHVRHALDVPAMQRAARDFVGRHDFAAFTANPNRVVESTVRTVTLCVVSRRGHEVRMRVRGEGFLYRQVRSMMGFLLRVGEDLEPATAVGELLSARASRTARVPTAPAQGLFLWQVWYGGRRLATGGRATSDRTLKTEH